MVYRINRIKNEHTHWCEGIHPAQIDIFPWAKADGYRPRTSAKMVVDGDSLAVFMETDETETRAEEKGFSNQVFTDSCMELFLIPDPANSMQYLNWEFNPVGAMYLSLGTQRHDRSDIREANYCELFQVKTMTHNGGWNLEYRVPLDFLRRFFPALDLKPGHIMRGNFYKCGDKTARPHFGCWSPINLPQPDFHCPDFFGTLIVN